MEKKDGERPALSVELVNIEALKEYPNNPRNHPEDQVERIAQSISKFGFRIPILITKDNEIVTGHGRLLASKKLGLKTAPCIRIEDLTEEEIRAFRIADNRVADTSWDLDKLSMEFKELANLKVDLKVTGFDEGEISFFNLDIIKGENDANAEWKGMPDFSHVDKNAHRTILVHFMTPEDVQEFSKLLKQTITKNTKYMYFPKQETMKSSTKRY